MSEKKRKTVTLDAENARLCDQHDNASALVNDLLTQYRQGGKRREAALELQIQHKREAMREKQQEAKRLEREMEELSALKQDLGEQENAELRKAREVLDGTPRDPANPAVKNWAEKLGMAPAALVDELEDSTE